MAKLGHLDYDGITPTHPTGDAAGFRDTKPSAASSTHRVPKLLLLFLAFALLVVCSAASGGLQLMSSMFILPSSLPLLF